MYSVAAVIPVKNGMPEIRDCINGILGQSVEVSRILVIDSGSTDGTLEYLQTIDKVILHRIAPESFNHGTTRNFGWQLCQEDFLLYTVQDARPANHDWIKNLLDGFDDDKVAGVCGQQVVPHERDKNPVQWFRPRSAASRVKYQFDRPQDFFQLSPFQKRNVCGWDNVTAMYKRSVLEKFPFQKTSFAEDAIWAREIICNGYALVYENEARVYHYHHETPEFVYRRAFTEFYHNYKLFGLKPSAVQKKWRRRLSFLNILLKEDISLSEKIKWYHYNKDILDASGKAISFFFESLRKGEHYLDVVHEQLCGIPPTPIKITHEYAR